MARSVVVVVLVVLSLLVLVSVAAAQPVTAPDGRTFALVNLRQRFDECSGAGGEHYVFDVEVAAGTPAVKAHAGGHAIRLGLLSHRATAAGDRWYVAELAIAARRSEDADDNPDSSVAGWCLDRIPATQAAVLRLITVADHDEGKRVLAGLAATGLPRASAVVGSIKPPATTRVAIVRVLERIDRDASEFRVERVEGAAPDVIDFATLPVWTDDLVVVAVASRRGASTVTHALVADDLAEAKRWKTAVAAGWPPDAQVTGWSGAYAVARWSAAGKVKGGRRRCGLEVELATWSGSSFQIEPARVAAPPGARAKDVVTGVVVPQPPDRCGRVARFVRAYATPGATRADWMVAGEPAPSAALVE